MTQNRGSIKECLKQWIFKCKKKFGALVALFLAVFNLRTWNSQHAKYTKNTLKQSWSCSKGEAAAASANIKESVDIFDRQWTPRAIVLSKSAISHATMCPYQNTERKIPCKNCLQRHILFRKYLCRTYPLQELSLETISFAETVFANLILYRNCLCRPYPLQELPLQIKFFTHKNFLFTLQSFKKLLLGNHNLSGKASLQLSFSGKHSSRYLNILHKFHLVTFYNFF